MLRDFFSTYTLYTDYIVKDGFEYLTDSEYLNPFDYIGETFEYYCQKEKCDTLFELDIDRDLKNRLSGLPAVGVPDEFYTDGIIDFTFKAIGNCKSCKDQQIYFLLRVYSDLKNSPLVSHDPLINIQLPQSKIFIQKVGSYPKPVIEVNKSILKYFDRETSNWYYKANLLLKEGYGIGAFAYFRRIIEKTLISIVEDIKQLPDADSVEIGKLISEYSKSGKNHVIYENIFHYLPASLKILGENPIQLLYQQTSEGLHSLSEQECLERSKSILMLLDFAITKIYEERSILKDIKEAIKKLK